MIRWLQCTEMGSPTKKEDYRLIRDWAAYIMGQGCLLTREHSMGNSLAPLLFNGTITLFKVMYLPFEAIWPLKNPFNYLGRLL